VLVAVGAKEDELRMLFHDVHQAGVLHCEYCMSWRDGMRIFVAREPIQPLSRFWPQIRHFE
jgi:hypothetical protein